MHTIKGNARTYNFVAITDVAHSAETTYYEMRKDSSTAWDKDKILAELKETRRLVKIYETIYIDKLAGSTAAGLFVERLTGFDRRIDAGHCAHHLHLIKVGLGSKHRIPAAAQVFHTLGAGGVIDLDAILLVAIGSAVSNEINRPLERAEALTEPLEHPGIAHSREEGCPTCLEAFDAGLEAFEDLLVFR